MIHKNIKHCLGFDGKTDSEFLEQWRKLTSKARKPCWDLKYCPYGTLVEQFPLLLPTRDYSIRHNEYIKACLKKGLLGIEPDVKPMNEKIRKMFEYEVKIFNPNDYPEEIPSEISKWSCEIFGHICPVIFSAENVAEKPR